MQIAESKFVLTLLLIVLVFIYRALAGLKIIASHAVEKNIDTEIHLVTTFFKGKYSNERLNEILESVKLNLENEYISYVHLLWEDFNPSDLLKESLHHKLILERVSTQPTYATLFKYANSLPINTMAMIANADIYFDESIACLAKATPTNEKKMISLTRRHSKQCQEIPDHKKIFDLCLHYIGSHDSFIFRVPLDAKLYGNLNYVQNIGLGVENRVLWEFQHNGYKVYNPCELIRSYHLHCSNERTYKNKGQQVSMKKYNNGTRKHGWVKPWWFKDEFTCPFAI